MRFKKVLTAIAAISMAGTPALAAAPNSASKLSVSKVVGIPASARAGATTGKSKAIGGGILVLILAAAAVAAGIVAATSGSSSPDSP